MKTSLIVALVLAIAVFATSSVILDRLLLDVFAFLLMLLLVLILRRSGRPWWLPSLLFAFLGASHLLAIWWLRLKGNLRQRRPRSRRSVPDIVDGGLLLSARTQAQQDSCVVAVST
jgi:hypothetical protein